MNLASVNDLCALSAGALAQRKRKRENARRWARIPRTDGDAEQEKGERHVADLEPLQQKRRAERHGNGHNGKAIALHQAKGSWSTANQFGGHGGVGCRRWTMPLRHDVSGLDRMF
jgi:hypothetical protein